MYKLHYMQKLPISLEEAWDFFSSPANLSKITPPSLAFKIKHQHENQKMYAGQLTTYTIRPFWNINYEWVTEITAVQKLVYFIDEQKFGPYSFWHHEHWFSSIQGGIQMDDIVFYKLPFGIIGKVLHDLKIKKDLDDIFAYRRTVLEQMFGILNEKEKGKDV